MGENIEEENEPAEESDEEDGFTDPCSPNRFCLGMFSNVHRDVFNN